MRVLTVSLVMLLFGAILVMPSSTAQSTVAAVTVFTELGDGQGDGRLRPETEELVGSVWARITVPAFSVCMEPVPVFFEARTVPGYAMVVIHDPIRYVPVRPSLAPVAYDVKTLVTISITRDAPAYEDGLYEFAVHLAPSSMQGGCNLAPSTGWGRATIKNDYVPAIHLGEATVVHEGLAGWIDVPIENHANGPTRVRAVLAPEFPHEWVLYNANDIVLESRVISGADSAWSGVMRIHYVLDDSELASVKVHFVAGHDQSQSDVETIDAVYWAIGTLPQGGESTDSENVEPLEDGSVATLPGPSIPVLMLVGALLLALVRRRRQ